LSKAFPVTLPFRRGLTWRSRQATDPTPMPASFTSASLLAPTSMNMFSTFTGFFLSSSSSRWGGLEPITPYTGPLLVRKTTLSFRRVCSNHPPRGTNLMKPFSSMCFTISPISSRWAATMQEGSEPFLTAMRFPMASLLISSTCPWSSALTTSATSSSLPETPTALESLSSSSLIPDITLLLPGAQKLFPERWKEGR